MIKIKTADLREFLKLSRTINNSTVIPILSFIKMECIGETATLTKTNMGEYLIHEIKAEFDKNTTLLIDEKQLSALLTATSCEEIWIKEELLKNSDLNGFVKKITLMDESSNLTFVTEDIDNFPVMPEEDNKSELSLIEGDVIDAISAARGFINAKVQNQYANVFVTNNEVFATNSATLYLKHFDKELPELVLPPETFKIICNFEELCYSRAGNYDFFETGKTKFGFIASTYHAPNYHSITDGADKSKYFEISKKDVGKFCNMVISSCGGAFPEASFKEKGDESILFQYNNNDYENSIEVIFDIEKNYPIKEFSFNASLMESIIHSLPYSKICFSKINNGTYSIWSKEDNEFMAIISGIVSE